MRLIRDLSEQIEEEIEDARKYIRCALRYKEERPDLAQTYARLSEEEMEHMNRLHSSVAGIIAEYRRENGEPPASMLAVYEYLHEKHTDAAAEVKAAQDLFRR